MERAPLWEVLGVGRVAPETGGIPAEPLVADLRERGRERRGVRMLGVVEHLVGGALFHQPTRVHDGQAIGDLDQHREVVRDEDHREAELVLELLHEPEHLGLNHDVEGGGGLVGEDDGRATRQRHRDHHPLLLAAGELVRVVGHPARGQAHLLQQRADADLRLALVRLAVHDDGLGDLIADPAHRVQRVQRSLEHHRGAGPPHGAQPPRLHREDVLPVQEDLTLDLGVLRVQPHDGARDRGLAAAGLTGETQDLPLLHVERHAAHRGDGPALRLIGDAQVADLQDAHRDLNFGLRMSSRA